MARDTLGFEYTGDNDMSRMPGDEVDDDDIVDRLARIFKDMPPYTVVIEDTSDEDDDIVDRLARIFKDMPPYTACPIPEYSAARPLKEVSSRASVSSTQSF
jgi:hypothetical protein